MQVNKNDRDIVLSMFRVGAQALKKAQSVLEAEQGRLERARKIVESWK